MVRKVGKERIGRAHYETFAMARVPLENVGFQFLSLRLCVPKIRFCNIGGEGRRELGVT
jgi:hypothetical protein